MRDTPAPKYWGALLITIGATLAAAGLTFWFSWGFPQESAPNQVVLGIVVHVLFGYIVVMSGIAIYRSDLDDRECLVAGKWCLGGFALMSALVAWAASPDLLDGRITLAFLNQWVVVGSVGAAAGVLVGLNRGQAVQNERLVDRKAAQQETLLFVLRLLRHDIRNDLSAIAGHVDLLESELGPVRSSDAPLEHAAHVRDRIRGTKELLRTADAVIESETGRRQRDRVDLESVIRRQVDCFESTRPLSFEVDLGTDLDVVADDFVAEVFRNVFDNAATHNPVADLRVTVTARRDGDEVTVVVADDGTGIPDHLRESVFEPGVNSPASEGDGLGLYLVRKLVESYDGSVTVAAREPSGTEFTMRFQAA